MCDIPNRCTIVRWTPRTVDGENQSGRWRGSAEVPLSFPPSGRKARHKYDPRVCVRLRLGAVAFVPHKTKSPTNSWAVRAAQEGGGPCAWLSPTDSHEGPAHGTGVGMPQIRCRRWSSIDLRQTPVDANSRAKAVNWLQCTPSKPKYYSPWGAFIITLFLTMFISSEVKCYVL